jgi:lipoprotein-anchoring transpeptidase ErfK/SrfK
MRTVTSRDVKNNPAVLVCFLSIACILFLSSLPAFAAEPVRLVVTKSAFTLELFEGETLVETFPVAIGKNGGDKQAAGDFRTPEGEFAVSSIEDSRKWTHDFGDGKGRIKGAYGPWFIRLETGWKGIGIHGTHDPASIGTAATEGCIRLANSDLLRLVARISVGTCVTILP